MFTFIDYFVMVLSCNDTEFSIIYSKRFVYINAIVVFSGRPI
jgi:hypothetical protein